MSANERSRLLGNKRQAEEESIETSQRHDEGEETTLLKEGRVLLGYTLPLAAMHMLRNLVQTISVLCIGHLGTRELAGANLGLLTLNILGYFVQIGLISSLDTLNNQAATSSSPKLLSIYTMRAFVVCCMSFPPMYLAIWNTESLLLLVVPHADPEMLAHAAIYAKAASLGIPALAGFDCLRRYLASMGMLNGPLIVYSIGTPISIMLSYLFTFKWLGFIGAPLAVAATYWVLFLLLAIYTWLAAPRYAWAGVSMAIFQDLGLNIRYGIAGVISTCSEDFGSAVSHADLILASLRLGATYLGAASQATNAIALTLIAICYQLPFSISQAISIRVGNLLGADLPQHAKIASKAAQLFAFLSIAPVAILLQVFRHSFVRLFSSDPEVISLFDRMSWLVATAAFSDGLQSAYSGVLKGAGLPTTASRVNLFSYWLVGLPVGALLTVKLQQVEGLWAGLSVALFVAASLMSIWVSRCDWDGRADEAQKRMAASDAVLSSAHCETEAHVTA